MPVVRYGNKTSIKKKKNWFEGIRLVVLICLLHIKHVGS